MFKEPVPGFNIAGKVGAGSLVGSLSSLFIIIIMALYGLIKIEHLLNKHSPTITGLVEPQEFDEQMSPVSIYDDTGMHFAYSIMSTGYTKSKLDPRYVKIITRVYTSFANGTATERLIGHHPCTEDDWAKFAPPDKSAEVLLQNAKKSNKITFICLDWERDSDEINIGRDKKGSYQRLDFMVTPCNYVHDYMGYEDTITDECIADETAQRKYLANFRISVYASSYIFDPQSYGDDSIKGSSKFHSQQVT